MHPHPAGRPFHRIPMVALAILSLAGWGLSLADSRPEPVTSSPSKVQLKTNRLVGLAPMNLEVSAIVRNADKDEILVGLDHRVVLEVESSFFRMTTGAMKHAVVSTGFAEFEATEQHPDPMKRNLLLQRPGTYTFRWLIEDDQGNRILSNAVEVRVL